jgi:hypothetical protein
LNFFKKMKLLLAQKNPKWKPEKLTNVVLKTQFVEIFRRDQRIPVLFFHQHEKVRFVLISFQFEVFCWCQNNWNKQRWFSFVLKKKLFLFFLAGKLKQHTTGLFEFFEKHKIYKKPNNHCCFSISYSLIS